MNARPSRLSVVFVTLLLAAAVAAQTFAQAKEQPKVQPQPRNRDQGRRAQGVAGGGQVNWQARRQAMQGDYVRRQIDAMVRGQTYGRPLSTQIKQWLDRNGDKFLILSSDLNAVDAAHLSIAEIHLKKKQYEPCLARLQTIITQAGGKENDAVSLAYLNRANVQRKHIGNVQQAIKEYKLVKGRWQALSLALLLDCYSELGQLDKAVDVLMKEYGAENELGLKLGLLRQVAKLYEKNDDLDKALAYYDRITKEFTREQIDKITDNASKFAETMKRQAEELKETGREAASVKLRNELNDRIAIFRAQGRDEEADAMQRIQRGGANPTSYQYRTYR